MPEKTDTKKTVALVRRPHRRTPSPDKKKMVENKTFVGSRTTGTLQDVLRKFFHRLGEMGYKKIEDIARMPDGDKEFFIRSQGHTYECFSELFVKHKRKKNIHFSGPIFERQVKALLQDKTEDISFEERSVLEGFLEKKKSKVIEHILKAREDKRFEPRRVTLLDDEHNPILDPKTGKNKTKIYKPLKSEPLQYEFIDRENAFIRIFAEEALSGIDFVGHFHVEPNNYPYIGREIALMIFGRYLLVQVDSCDGQHLFEYFLVPLKDEFLDKKQWMYIPTIAICSRKHVKKDVGKFGRIVDRVAKLTPNIIRRMTYYGEMLHAAEMHLESSLFDALKYKLFDQFIKLRLEKGDNPASYYKAFFQNSMLQTDQYVYWLWMLLSALCMGKVVGVDYEYEEVENNDTTSKKKKKRKTGKLLFGQDLSLRFTKSLTTEIQIDTLQNGMFDILENEFGKIPGLSSLDEEE